MRSPLTFLALILLPASALADFRAYQRIPVSTSLQQSVQELARETLERYRESGLEEGHFSISLVDLTDVSRPVRAAYREEIPYHPASVVKMFYLVTVQDQLENGRLTMSGDLERAVEDMIVVSGNDSTSYVIDRISGVTSGPELHGRAFRRWAARRGETNRWFHSRGYDINANGKTWCENVYGREKQLLGANREYRNRITSAAAASLMYALSTGTMVSPDASRSMLALMSREIPAADEETQIKGFLGESLPAGSRMYSKAGWTGEVRHDVGLVELPNGRRYVLAVLTRGASGDESILPHVSSRVRTLFE